MDEIINVYCDESCHLEHDRQKAMVLGAVWCPLEKTKNITAKLQKIKVKHGLRPHFEAKWTKVSNAKLEFYKELIEYFFDDPDLHFRALVVPDKTLLRHKDFPGQDHDSWYYKMYFDMLKAILQPTDCYRIYLDIKDTRGAQKAEKLRDVLCNNMYDFSRQMIERLQLVHSKEIVQLQLADLLIGAVAYVNRQLSTSEAKMEIISQIQNRSGYQLTRSTLLLENKMNIFIWEAS
jgi:hypothetical protein